VFRRNYEVRARFCATGEDAHTGWERFFFRKSAESWCMDHNAMLLLMGYSHITHYVHDLRDDD
jgi:hypothetical protein